MTNTQHAFITFIQAV